MRKTLISALVLTSSAFVAAQQADGAVVYSYVTDASTYTPGVGQVNVDVQVYLRETVTEPSASLLSPAVENGLLGAGFAIERTNPSSSSATFGSFTRAAIFSGPAMSDTSANRVAYSVSTAPNATQGAMLEQVGDFTQVFLGTLALNVGASNTSFSLGRLNDLGGNTLTYENFLDLDFDSADPEFVGATGTTSFTVAAVPEPTTVALIGMAALVLGIHRPSRRATSAVAVA
jgi:hypothetical protein